MRKFLYTISLLLLAFSIGQQVYAQSSLVTGFVVDQEGVPLPGVTIMAQGAETGAITSIDGKYAISNLKTTDTIMYSFIGYETQYKNVGENTIINIVLKTSTELLDEVQVVAFQKQKKESVIASINTIRPEELKLAPTNLTTALAGRLAGIISYQRSGEPGADNAQFFIRGVTSFGYANSPLILIDGLEVTSNDLARIEPDNIASFSIMKDATATALYGARGANGVILVTTKEGKAGKAKISVRVDNSLSLPTMTNEFLGAVDYMEMYNRALRTRENDAILFYSKDKIEGTRRGDDPMIYPNVDWYGQLFRDYVFNKKANMNVSGGGEIAQYYLSVSYTNEKGLLNVDPVNDFNNNIDINRYNLRANINLKLTRTTNASVKFYSLFDRYNGPFESANDIFNSVMDANPVNFPMYFEKDDEHQFVKHTMFGNKGNGNYSNPYADMVKGFQDRNSSTIFSQFQIEQKLDFITKGLNFRGMAAIKAYANNVNQRMFNPFYYGLSEVDGPNGVEHSIYQIKEGTEFLIDPIIYNSTFGSYYFELITQYNRTFAKRHDLGGLLVVNRMESLDGNVNPNNPSLSSLPSRNLGVSGRFTYAYNSRYMTELNFGYNGSEKFAKNHRFGFFPSVGLGWAVSNEKFMENINDVVSMLKLKWTYGLVGNDAIAAADQRFFYLSSVNLNSGGRGYSFGSDFNNRYNGYMINRYANQDITWEIAYKTNYGVELGLFNKVDIMVDVFNELRTNIYMQRQYTPLSMGLTSPIYSNLGEAYSKGVDASLDYQHFINTQFWITSRWNFTYSTNEYYKTGEPEYEYDYLSHIGQPINQQWGFVAERLFVDDNEVINSPSQFGQQTIDSDAAYRAGDIKYVDINKDGKIDDLDRVPIGYPSVPEIVYGFGASMGYGDLDFSFFFQGLARESFFIDPTKIAPFINERNALTIIADDHWSDENPDPYAFWPRMSTQTISNNEKPSTWWLRDGSFLRLKSLELGYTLPHSMVQKFKIEEARLYFTGTNLLTFSKFKLWDPEMASNGLGYPPQKVFNIGINIKM